MQVRVTARAVEQAHALDRGLGQQVLVDLGPELALEQGAGQVGDGDERHDRQHPAEQQQATAHGHGTTSR